MKTLSPDLDALELNGEAPPSVRSKFNVINALSATCAIAATLISLVVVTYLSWNSGGSIIERSVRMCLGCVVVLAAHLLPMVWHALRNRVRQIAYVLWSVAIAIVFYGQTTFYIITKQHAGDFRVEAASVSFIMTDPRVFTNRTRTAIAKDLAKLSTDLARAQARPCVAECPSLKVLRTRLAAEIAALNAEDHEAKRKEANEDRYNAQVDRADQLRMTLRRDPVVSQVASWLGTTEPIIELLIGLAHAVVLEGVAVIGWILLAVARDRSAIPHTGARDHLTSTSDCPSTEEIGSAIPLPTTDEQLLEQMHVAVVAGKLKLTQVSIRNFFRCGQQKAGRLNREYLAHFNGVPSQDRKVPAAGGAISGAPDP